MDVRRYSYRGYEYITCGGPVVPAVMNILECFDLPSMGPYDVPYRHLMIEAMRRAWTDNLYYMGDPKYENVPDEGIISKAYGCAQAEQIDLRRAARDVRPGDPWQYQERKPGPDSPLPGGWPRGGPPGGDHTTQVVAIDRDGNMATMMTTLGTWFGSMVSIPGTGIILGNGIQAFDPRPGNPNSIKPGKRCFKLSASILVFKDGKPFAAFAASGGRRITCAVLHELVNVLDFRMGIQDAIESWRLHVEQGPVLIDSRVPEKMSSALESMGHELEPVEEHVESYNFGRAVGALIDPITHKRHGGADPMMSTGVAGI
jgi:gamma-glutamyltranspeptidase / glutathione hydrolase